MDTNLGFEYCGYYSSDFAAFNTTQGSVVIMLKPITQSYRVPNLRKNYTTYFGHLPAILKQTSLFFRYMYAAGLFVILLR